MLSVSRLMLAMLAIIGLNCPVMVIAEDYQLKVLQSDVLQKEMQEDALRRVHVRGLAASCVACHDSSANGPSANGSSNIASLAGINAADFIAKLQAFKSGERLATVMHHHAKGLNSQEITDLAAYFAMQTPRKFVALPSQKLLAEHAN